MDKILPENDHKSPRKHHWVILCVFLTLSVFLVHANATNLQASVIPTKQHAAYDGTTLPILNIPDWVHLTSDEWDMSYNEMPSSKLIAVPEYDPNDLKTSTSSLGWSSQNDLDIRNAKITYSVPYMGNYKLDGTENSGSHLAVDLKIPNNTPIYAIGNGIVYKVSEQNTGFGKHIVLLHKNFPSFNNPNNKETLYSSYNHMGTINVSEGDVVKKGQNIGKSGESGTATTPHLHFQIDNDDAPWHPYWPFTFYEANDAGFSFAEAVNEGLGQEKALATTVNPMLYVQKYIDSSASTTTVNTSSSGTSTSTTSSSTTSSTSSDLPPAVFDTVTTDTNEEESNTVDTTDTTEATDTVEVEEIVIPAEPAVGFKVTHDGDFVADVTEVISIEAVDKDGNQVKAYTPTHGVYLKVLVGSADVPTEISANEFMDGTATVNVTPRVSAGLQLEATDNEISGTSAIMENSLFSDVEPGSEYYRSIDLLKDFDVIEGYPDGSFKPDQTVSRVEALKFILAGVDSDLIVGAELKFSDTDSDQWYAPYIYTAYTKGIVDGYPDSTFKPSNTVNKVEFIKMLLIAMDTEIHDSVTEAIYDDVPSNAWFAPYVKYAKEKNLIETDGNFFNPEEDMTRAQVAEAIYRMIILKVSGESEYNYDVRVGMSKISNYFNVASI